MNILERFLSNRELYRLTLHCLSLLGNRIGTVIPRAAAIAFMTRELRCGAGDLLFGGLIEKQIPQAAYALSLGEELCGGLGDDSLYA